MPESPYPISIFYDGACGMCRKQMAAFTSKDVEKRLVFIDISVPDFSAEQYGLKGEPLQKFICAKTSRGEVVRGVDAFRLMWRATNRPLPAFLVGLPVVKQIGKAVYNLVSTLRYRLSGQKESVCDFHCAKEL